MKKHEGCQHRQTKRRRGLAVLPFLLSAGTFTGCTSGAESVAPGAGADSVVMGARGASADSVAPWARGANANSVAPWVRGASAASVAAQRRASEHGRAAGAKGPSRPPRSSAGGAALDVEGYDLVGEFDWSDARLHASLTVTLGVSQAPPEHVVLDSTVNVHTVRLSSGEALPFSADAGAATLSIELGGHATPGVAFVIEYDAATPQHLSPGTALEAFDDRDGDPNPSRVAYTFSEPERARNWLPSHDDPADRAYFSIDLRVEEGDRLIANGDLLADSTGACGGGEGRMKYATSYPLPTYLMAFAIGEFEVEEKKGPHGLPLSVWHRRGLPGDYHGTLDELSRLIRRFEKLTGVPYPFEKYALVLVPDIGGEEHASITFQGEADSAQPDYGPDLVLTAHELGHQWFGDLVTVSTWNDLWIKEGMATLLEWEGTRQHVDGDGLGLFGGDSYYVAAGDAVRDVTLPPEEKYGAGPYTRAAWLLTQMRVLVGEDAFWGALRQTLTEHRFGSVDREAFLEPFRASLGEEGLARVRQATDALGLPVVTVEPLEGGARITIDDPEATLLLPVSVAWHRADGQVETIELAPGVPTDLVRESPDDFLIVDPPNAHPSLSLFLSDESYDAYFGSLEPLRVPTTAAQRARLLASGGAHQLAVLFEIGTLPAMPPEDFDDFLRDLDSEEARAAAVGLACGLAASEGGAWKKATKRALRQRRRLIYGLPYAYLKGCADVLPVEELFPADWQKLSTGLAEPLLDELEVEFLAQFSAGSPDESLSLWSNLFEHGYSTRVRRSAANALQSAAFSIALADRPAWQSHIAELLASTATFDGALPLVFTLRGLGGPTAADNAAGLDGYSAALHRPTLHIAHRFMVCSARRLVKGNEAVWATFVASVEDAELSAPIRTLLAAPGPCGGL